MGLAALLALFFLSSCITKDPTLGSELVPSNQDITIRTVVLDLPVSTAIADDLPSSISDRALVGSLRTDEFGLFTSEAIMSLTASTDSIIWGANPTVTGVSLDLNIDTTMVTDKSQFHIPQSIHVHAMTMELDTTCTSQADLIGKEYCDPTPVSKGGAIYTGGDSFSIPLKNEFGERFLRLPMETLDSAALLSKQIPGLCVRCDAPIDYPGYDYGRLNSFDLSSSYLKLIWEYSDEEGNRRSKTAFFNLGKYHLLNVYGTDTASPASRADARDLIPVQGLNGVKPFIDALQLRSTVARWAGTQGIPLENLVIAKATVEFPFEYKGNPDQFYTYAPNLFPCRRKSVKGRTLYSPIDEISNSSMEHGSIDRSQLCYKSNISIHLQKLIQRSESGITSEDNLWLMGTVTSVSNTTGETFYYSDNVYYTQTMLNGTAALRHPLLRITYTVLK